MDVNTITIIPESEHGEHGEHVDENTTSSLIVPKIVFIIPYRDRVEHKEFFTVYMKHVLEDIPKTDYEIYFVEQKNTLPFNRGAMKNIGFFLEGWVAKLLCS